MTERNGRRTDLTTAVTVREVERKIAVPEGFSLPPLLGQVPGIVALRAREPSELVAAYHDTVDHRLARAGASLRRREGGPDSGWHLKLPAPQQEPGRDEIRLPLAAGEVGQVPESFAALVLPLVRGAPLAHLGTARTARAGWDLVDADGEVIAELVDDHVVVEPGGRHLRQLEIEACVPDERADEVLDAVVGLLVAAGGSLTTRTKAAAALGVDDPDGPVAIPASPRRGEPAGVLVRHVLATGVRDFLLADVDVRRRAPDAVHRMRVAARRLRSVLQVLSPLLDRDWAAALRAELRETAAAWGAVRDFEVQLGLLLTACAALPAPESEVAARAVRESLRAREGEALGDANAALYADRHLALVVDLVGAVAAPQLSGRAARPIVEVVPALVSGAVHQLRDAVEGLTLDATGEEWHRARVLAKRARYATDAVVPVLRRARRPAEQLSVLTELLGQVQDVAVGRRVLAGIAARSDSRAAYALGLLAGRQEQVELEARAAVLAAWPRIDEDLLRPLVRR